MQQMDAVTAQASCLKILKEHADALGLSVEAEEAEEDGVRYIRYDVSDESRPEVSDKWFCFSVVLIVPTLKVSIWTREAVVQGRGLFKSVTDFRPFEPVSFDQWLDEWFEDAVLEELTKP